MDVKCLRMGNLSILHSKNGDTICGTVICGMFNLPVQVWVILSRENISTLIRHYRYWRMNKRGKNVLLEISVRISFSSWRYLMREGRRRSRIDICAYIYQVWGDRKEGFLPAWPPWAYELGTGTAVSRSWSSSSNPALRPAWVMVFVRYPCSVNESIYCLCLKELPSCYRYRLSQQISCNGTTVTIW